MIPVYDRQGVELGYVADGSYYIRKRKEHFMRMFNGFGLSTKIIEQIKYREAKKIIFIYEGSSYSCPISKFEESEKTWTDTSMGRNDEQKFVSITEMTKL